MSSFERVRDLDCFHQNRKVIIIQLDKCDYRRTPYPHIQNSPWRVAGECQTIFVRKEISEREDLTVVQEFCQERDAKNKAEGVNACKRWKKINVSAFLSRCSAALSLAAALVNGAKFRESCI